MTKNKMRIKNSKILMFALNANSTNMASFYFIRQLSPNNHFKWLSLWTSVYL